MRYGKVLRLVAVLLTLVQMSGCGTSGGASKPSEVTTSPVTSDESDKILSYNLNLTVTPTAGSGTTVSPNSTVIATGILKDSSGNPIANQAIRFEAVEGPVTMDPATVMSDSSGKAIKFLTTGATTTSAVDVIIKASTSINGQYVTAISLFKIIRSATNIIQFLPSNAPGDPDGILNTLKVSLLEIPTPAPPRTLLQLVPFQVLDNNGAPRSRIPVKITVYSKVGNCPVFIDSPEKAEQTVTTDDTGLGIFNGGVTLEVPSIGSQNTCSVIYKAEAADPNNPTGTIYSYGGFIAVLQNLKTGQTGF